MLRCDFNKLNRTSSWVFSFKFATYFPNLFSEDHLEGCFCGLRDYFEKWEKMCLDDDENITITCFFCRRVSKHN